MAGAICAALFAFSFAAAPHACEWGLAAYFFAGIAGLLALLAIPLVMLRPLPLGPRLGLGVVLALAGAAVWLAGLFVANVRIVCRLF